MIISNIEPTMIANRWYPLPKDNRRSYKSYPTPQSLLRASLGEDSYKFVCETVTSEHIRAAAILPLEIPFDHLLNEPWAMNVRESNWRMIMVSAVDPLRWIQLARASGAVAWLKASSMTYVYQWEPPKLDATGAKVRPANALGITGQPAILPSGRKKRNDTGRAKKDYDRDEIVADLLSGQMNHTEIGLKHGLNRITIMKIAHSENIREREM